MKQLEQDQLNEIIEGIKANQFIRTTVSHPWVKEDGAYENVNHSTREFVWNGFVYLTASRGWIEDEVQNKRLPEWMRAPWGTYPEMPPKPPKK